MCNTYDRDLGGAFGSDVCSCRDAYHQGGAKEKTNPLLTAAIAILLIGFAIAFIIEVIARTDAANIP